MTRAGTAAPPGGDSPAGAWKALAALVVGFFMILVDQTIVAVASETFMVDLHATPNQVIWVTSAYLLAYVVPLLFAGRLGDHVGPKKLSIAGLVVFTAASLWCGFSTSIEMLIVARVVQGVGAALLTPQSMSVITRVFPPERRGAAMGLWGSVAGIASVVGPVAGGFLVDHLGWEWIFFVNLPFGILAVVLVLLWVPDLPTNAHRYDVPGIVLSAAGMLLLVFGIQEGEQRDWDTVTLVTIAAGVVLLAVFVWWQGRLGSRPGGEPFIPLSLFRDRNFSLGNAAITTMGFAVAGTMVPLMLYFQGVLHRSPTESGLMLLPMAIISGVLAPFVGRRADSIDPRILTVVGYLSFGVALVWLWAVIGPDTPVTTLLWPIALMGVANGFVWAPTSSTSMRRLDVRLAGAGSGVYNTTRQVGAVLGSACIGALMQSRIAATGGDVARGVADSMLLPAALIIVGGLLTLGFSTGARRPAERVGVPT